MVVEPAVVVDDRIARRVGRFDARLAAEQAISSQLLDITIDGARGILFNVTGGPEMTLFEVNQAAAIIKETAHPDVNLIFGAVIDPQIGEEIRITVIATGIERTNATARRIVEPATRNAPRQQSMHSAELHGGRDVPSGSISANKTIFEPRTVNTDDLDVPTFLRNRINK